MSTSFGCDCGERKKPLSKRNWVISDYRCNYSAFNGYHRTISDYSTLVCRNPDCHGCGRTKAAYVDELYMLQDMEEAIVGGDWLYTVKRDTTEPEWWK